MTLNLPPELERAIEARVRSGRFASRESVLLACVEVLEERRGNRPIPLARLRNRLDAGGQPHALARQVEKLLVEQTRGGRYASVAAVVEAGLQLLAEEEEWSDELRREVQVGLDEIDRGEIMDREEVLARLREARKGARL